MNERFEYDLALSGLPKEVWLAAHLAKADDYLHAGKTTTATVVKAALRSFKEIKTRKQHLGGGDVFAYLRNVR